MLYGNSCQNCSRFRFKGCAKLFIIILFYNIIEVTSSNFGKLEQVDLQGHFMDVHLAESQREIFLMAALKNSTFVRTVMSDLQATFSELSTKIPP